MATIRLGSQIICPIKLEKANNTTLFVTPSSSSQTILSNDPVYTRVTTYPVTYEVDSNIIASNIKDGVEILGIVGTYKNEPTYYTAIPKNCIAKILDENGKLKNSNDFIEFSGVTTLGNRSLAYAYACNHNITEANLDSIITINGTSALWNTFFDCINLTSVSFNNLTNITGEYALGEAFKNCTGLTELYFPALAPNGLGSTYTNQFNNMLQGCSNVVVHFPVYLESVIGSWTDITNSFGGTNITILFDLPGHFRDSSLDLVYDSTTDSYIPVIEE